MFIATPQPISIEYYCEAGVQHSTTVHLDDGSTVYFEGLMPKKQAFKEAREHLDSEYNRLMAAWDEANELHS